MSNREISMASAGIAVGIMLGVSSLLYGQDTSLEAASRNLNPLTRPASVVEEAQQNRSPAALRRLRLLQPAEIVPAAAPAATARRADTETCRAVTDATARIEIALSAILPTSITGNRDNDKNMRVLQMLAQTSDVLVEEYCPEVVEEQQKAAAPTINNNCRRFVNIRSRYTTCLDYQEGGLRYP